MSVHSFLKNKKRDCARIKFSGIGSHKKFLERITKTLYYGNLSQNEGLSLPVTELAAELFSEVKTKHSVERLRLDEASEISRNACVSPCTLVLAIIYLEQLKTSNYCYVDKVSPSDLFIVSLMIATKFLNDCGEEDDFLNSEWAASVGLSLNEVNQLEREFLVAINWEVYVNQNNFWKRLRMIEKDIALKEGNKRGWFSYTDLENLLDSVNSLALLQTIFTVSAVCLASYTAALLTIIGSTYLVSQLPRYSLTAPLTLADNAAVDMLNISNPSPSNNMLPMHLTRENGTECEQALTNEINSRYSLNEIIKYLRNSSSELSFKNRNTNSSYHDTYLIVLYNYLRTFSLQIEDLSLKIGTLQLDTSYLIHDSLS